MGSHGHAPWVPMTLDLNLSPLHITRLVVTGKGFIVMENNQVLKSHIFSHRFHSLTQCDHYES
jgi:hypothetical protein